MTLRFSSTFILFLLLFSASYGQNKKAADKYYKKAYYEYGFHKYDDVLKYLEKALEKDTTHLKSLHLLADISHITRNDKGEEEAYLDILAIDSLEIRALINLGDLYLGSGQFYKALDHMLLTARRKPHLSPRYHKRIELMIYKAQFAIKMLENPFNIQMERMPDGINSEKDEYWPYLSPDGNTMYFTRTEWVDKLLEAQDYLEENIYQSVKKNGKWQKAQRLSNTINTLENEGAQVLTQDGNTLYFTACNKKGFEGDCNLFVSYKKAGKWTKPKKLQAPINTPYKESQPSISYDGKLLFFSSDRPGGSGGMDIWVTRMNKDSVWAYPKNLGPKINSPGIEESPFIHVDNNTLFFSSNGHMGMGNGDLFMVKLNDTVGPVNLGYPINNHRKQLGIMVARDGKTGYYSTVTNDSNQNLDIHSFKMPANLTSDPICYLAGHVLDHKGKGTIAFIEVHETTTGKRILTYETSPDGAFSFSLPSQKNYSVVVNKAGYLLYNTEARCSVEEKMLSIQLEPIVENKSFVLRSVFFDFNSAELKTESVTAIEHMAEFLMRNPEVIIEIGGHTDSIGTSAFNKDLSLRRAKAVQNALLGVVKGNNAKERIVAAGYGSLKPLATNDSEAGRAQNRRTEVKIIGLLPQD